MRPRRLSLLAGAAAAAASFVLCAPHALAQPVNNHCADAVTVSSGAPVQGTTAGATLEHDFAFCQPDVSDVWYSFTAPAAGPYEFSVSGESNENLSITIVSGCMFPMGIYGCTTGAPGVPARLEHLVHFPGENIRIRVGSLNGAAQTFTVSAGPLPPPSNDHCSSPVALQLGVPHSTNNLSATTSVELPMAAMCSSIAPGIAGGADLFFSFTPSFDGYYDFSTCGADIDTVVSVHTGCPVSEANVIACNDNSPIPYCPGAFGTHAAYLAGVPLAAGQTYIIRVASVLPYNPWSGELGEPGRSQFTVTVQTGNPVSVPPNDTCETAAELPAGSFINGTTAHATGGPSGCSGDLGDHWDVWYSYTSADAEAMAVEFMLAPGAFAHQATLSAYAGCGGELITCQAFNPLMNPVMRIVVVVEPEETVQIRVAGLTGAQDNFIIMAFPLGTAAPNVGCGSAIAVSAGDSVVVDTSFAAAGEESVCGSGITDIYALWYAFTPTQAGYYRLAADLSAGASGGVSLALHPACGAPAMYCTMWGDAASEHPLAGAASVYLDAGQTVYARVAMLYAEFGDFGFSVAGPLPPPPPVLNDTCAAAAVIASMPYHASADVTLATPGPDICRNVGQPLVATPGAIWYSYTPQGDEVLQTTVFTTSGISSAVAVFTGECGSLTQVGCPEGFSGGSTFRLNAGVTYSILVYAVPGRHGLDLTTIPYGTVLEAGFISVPVPANDTCAGAERITENPASFTVNTLAASPTAPAPSCAGDNGQFPNSVWYSFRTGTAGTLTVQGVRAEGASFSYAPAGALFAGGCGGLTEVACGNPVVGFLIRDRFSFTAQLQAGQTYHLVIGAWGSGTVGGETNVSLTYTGDIAPACPADWNDDGAVNSSDISAFITSWLSSIAAGDLAADFNGDGAVNSSDISAFITAWLAGVTGGC